MDSGSNLKFIDLFAGIGGFHYSLHQLGCECVFASELDESARITYEKNYSKISPSLFEKNLFNDDIRNISPEELPDFDILCAGFPCQPFSQAGHKKGFNDGDHSERGNLFFNIVDILKAKRPKAFFLENVRGIVNHDGGRTFKIIREILEDELGYSFYFKVVKATDYGLPQHRPRAFMIGFRDEGFLKSFSFPPTQPLKFNMSDVFEGNCSRDIGFTLRVGGAGSNINDRRNWDSYLVDNEVVRIQPKHALKIQGFPEDFWLPSSRSAAMKQLGNSVAIDAVKACAESLIEHLKIIDDRTENTEGSNMKRNKGEWTELYTFLKMILDQELILSDSKLNPTKDKFSVSKVTTLNIDQEAHLNGNQIEVRDGGVSSKLFKQENVLTGQDLEKIRDLILEGSSTFEIEYAENIFKQLGIKIIRGGTSNQKADIVLDVSRQSKLYKDEGFGIKSYLGSSPTLLNASGCNTNFVYEITNFNDSKLNALNALNAINSSLKIKNRLEYIKNNGSGLEFCNIEAETMHYNLNALDADLPKLMSKMLLNFYLNRKNSLSDNLENLHSEGHFTNGLNDRAAHKIKLKRLLVAVLLGIFSGKKWDGKYTANGTIVVKPDGSQVAFHIVKLSDLEDYLYNEIKFDTPSTTRHRFASAYKETNGKYYFKLNLQLRF